MSREYVVRVVLFPHNRKGQEATLAECLRYAGVIKVLKDTDETLVFDIICPHKSYSYDWARSNAERMRSFSFNAEACPADQQV